MAPIWTQEEWSLIKNENGELVSEHLIYDQPFEVSDTQPPPPPDPDPGPGPGPTPGGGRLLCVDASQAPQGAPITIYAENLTAASQIMSGGVPAVTLIPLADDPLAIPHGRVPQRQRVTIEANGDIKLVGGNSISFNMTQGVVHEMFPGIIDLSNVNAGDLVLLHAGVYDRDAGGNRPGIVRPKNNVHITAYPGEGMPYFDCSNYPGISTNGHPEGWINCSLAQVEMDAKDNGNAMNTQYETKTNFRLVGMDIHNARGFNGNAGQFNQRVQGVYYLCSKIHDTGNGDNNSHGVYLGGIDINSGFYFRWNWIGEHEGGRGVQFYGHSQGESLDDFWLDENLIEFCHGNAAVLFGRTDHRDANNNQPPWLHKGWMSKNTIRNNNGVAIHIKSGLINLDLDENVLCDDINLEEHQRVAFGKNCMNFPLPIGAGVEDKEGNETPCSLCPGP